MLLKPVVRLTTQQARAVSFHSRFYVTAEQQRYRTLSVFSGPRNTRRLSNMIQKPIDMSSTQKILLLGEIDHAHEHWEALSDLGELITPKAKNREEFIKECKDGKLDGVVAAYRTFPSVAITGRFDEELCKVLPKSWKYLAHNGAGYDQMDPDACSARDPPLLISNCPTAVDDATADTAIFLMLGALRNFNTSMVALRKGDFKGKPSPALGHDPRGKVLGILGMGGIGRNMSKKAAAFGMTTIYHNRRKLDDEKAGGAKYVSFEELLKQCDVLSLNLPLSPKTRHMISMEQFKMMKPSAIVINTARGAVIDEAALVEALDQGIIAGAGLDVFEEEPKIHPGLVKNEKTILLPHMGTYTQETQEKMEIWVIDNIRSALEKGTLNSPIPEQQSK